MKRCYVLFLMMVAIALIPCSGENIVMSRVVNVDIDAVLGQPPLEQQPSIGTFSQQIVAMDRSRSMDDVVEKAREFVHTGFDASFVTRYSSAPVFTAPYSAGSLLADDIQDALNTLKMVRYIAGLPYDNITFDAELNNISQHGAVLMAASNQFTHSPTKPADMYQQFFALAERGCSEANISAGRSNISAAILQGFVADPQSSNIRYAGHRRWILKPGAEKFGIGYARNTAPNILYNGDRISMHIKDGPGPDQCQSDSYIAWPSPGDFPMQYFTITDDPPAFPWSINLGAPYMQPTKEAITLRLTRKRDNKVWVFDRNTPLLDTNNMPASSMHLAVDDVKYGMVKAIIFRPDLTSLGKILSGDVFTVNLSGIKTTAGLNTSLEYDIRFFDLDEEIEKVAYSDVRTTVYHNGQPLVGAEVTIDGRTARTNQNGFVGIRVPNNRTHEYTVEKDGYATETGTVSVGTQDVIKTVSMALPVQINISSTIRTYNNSPQGVVVSTVPAGVTYDVYYNGSTTVPTNAGTYLTVVAVRQNGYVGYAHTTLTINKAQVTVMANALSKGTGQADPVFTYSVVGNTHGNSFLGALARSSGETAGVYPINQGTLRINDNYDITFIGADFTIILAYAISVDTSGLTVQSGGMSGDVAVNITNHTNQAKAGVMVAVVVYDAVGRVVHVSARSQHSIERNENLVLFRNTAAQGAAPFVLKALVWEGGISPIILSEKTL